MITEALVIQDETGVPVSPNPAAADLLGISADQDQPGMEAPDWVRNAVQSPTDLGGTKLETRRILVIDDEDDIREVVQMTLEVFGGWHVQTAPSGSEGISVAEHWQPDAILLDMMMPELDGQSTFRLLRDGPATNAIPIIMLTATVQALELEALLQLGVTGVIAKPFLATELPEQIQAILGW